MTKRYQELQNEVMYLGTKELLRDIYRIMKKHGHEEGCKGLVRIAERFEQADADERLRLSDKINDLAAVLVGKK